MTGWRKKRLARFRRHLAIGCRRSDLILGRHGIDRWVHSTARFFLVYRFYRLLWPFEWKHCQRPRQTAAVGCLVSTLPCKIVQSTDTVFQAVRLSSITGTRLYLLPLTAFCCHSQLLRSSTRLHLASLTNTWIVGKKCAHQILDVEIDVKQLVKDDSRRHSRKNRRV